MQGYFLVQVRELNDFVVSVYARLDTVATSCKNLVNFGPVPVWKKWKNMAYSTQYLRMYTKFSQLEDMSLGMINVTFICRQKSTRIDNTFILCTGMILAASTSLLYFSYLVHASYRINSRPLAYYIVHMGSPSLPCNDTRWQSVHGTQYWCILLLSWVHWEALHIVCSVGTTWWTICWYIVGDREGTGQTDRY